MPRCAVQPGLDHAIPKVDEEHVHHAREDDVIRHLGAQHQVEALQQRSGEIRGGRVGWEKVSGKE